MNKIFKLLIILACISFNVHADTSIDMTGATVEIIDSRTIKASNIDVIGIGKFWAEFKWNPSSLSFDVENFGEGEAVVVSPESSQEVISGVSCSVVTADGYCDEGKYPTCVVDNITKATIIEGITYDEVVKTFGCNGILTSRSGNFSVYVWQSKSDSADAIITCNRSGNDVTPRVGNVN